MHMCTFVVGRPTHLFSSTRYCFVCCTCRYTTCVSTNYGRDSSFSSFTFIVIANHMLVVSHVSPPLIGLMRKDSIV